MSFIYSQALVEAFSQGKCLGIELSVQSSANPTPKPCLWHDKTMEASRLSRFGMTCEPLTESLGAELLTWWLAAFHARTYQQQVKAQESAEKEAGCGQNLLGSLAKYDPVTHSLKTAQCSLLGDLTESFQTLPRWGSMRNGDVFLQPKSARIMGVTESGLWQTPTSTQVPPRSAESWAKKQTDREATGRYTLPPGTLEEQVGISGVKPCWDYHKSPVKNNWATPTTMDKLPPKSEKALMREMTEVRPGRSQPGNLRDQVSNSHNWPTVQARDYKGSSGRSMKGQEFDLPTAVKLWPTPLASSCHGANHNSPSRNKDGAYSINLEGAVKSYPTPTACAAKGSSDASLTRADGRDRTNDRLDHNVFAQSGGGQLNPDWVEWLMGWLIGWTDLTATRLMQPDWTNDPANLPVDHPDHTPRVGNNIKHRTSRIKCIGNGQVPQCAATAWRILSERLANE